ncbi:BgTH12-03073 [Blumeria graminis f. sp. triticale]|nr:BgTH12-02910 [Blumeria graminis f. sp. triticale]CAD6503408.1 BgTH12-03073 [Blumeria graminis f. sp. triticale]
MSSPNVKLSYCRI